MSWSTSRKTKSVEAADLFIQIKPRQGLRALWALRALAKGVELDPAEVEAETGVPLAMWQGIDGPHEAGQVRRDPLRHGSDDDAGQAPQQLRTAGLGPRHERPHAVRLQTDARPGNVTGADNVVTWRTGYPFAVNLARGYPRFNPGEYTTADTLGRGEADAALIIASDPMSNLTQAAREHLTRIPSVVLDHKDTPTTRAATVVFHTATYGINTSGTVYRMDDVPIPLRPAFASHLPSDEGDPQGDRVPRSGAVSQ